MSRAQRSENRSAAVAAPVIVVDGFLPGALAAAMRRDLDLYFGRPESESADGRHVWDYRFVAGREATLRTRPERVIEWQRVAAFHQTLREWSARHLGMADVPDAVLGLYVGGCRQGWRRDPQGGRFAFAYSLTRNERRTTGGETLVMREGDPLRAPFTAPAPELCETIEPRFNRLVICDARLPRSVERVEGSMDPREGCLVLEGYLREGAALVAGALPASAVAGQINEALGQFSREAEAGLALYQGPLVVRLTIEPSGAVGGCDIMVDRVIHRDPGHADWEAIRAGLVARLRALKFAAAAGRTVLVQPVIFGARPPVGGRPG
jgi:hypothetical protein